jgi:hypothetical protein
MNGEELAKALMAEVRRDAEIRVTDDDTHTKLDDIKRILENWDKNLTKELKELSDTVERNLKELANRVPGASTSAAKTKPLNMGNLAVVMGRTYNAINNLNKTLLGGININMSKAVERALAGGGGGGGGGGAGPTGGGGGGGGGGSLPAALGDAGDAEAKRMTKITGVLVATNMVVNKALGMLSSGLQKIGLDWQNTFKGIGDGVKFTQDMRMFAYETQGAGVAMTNMEREYINLANVARETGQEWGKAATLYRKEMQRGLTTEVVAGRVHQRTAQDAMRLTKNSLRTANMIGASAEGTAELFSEWNRHLGLTNEQLSFVGREMEQVARNSGVTGDELLQATKAASVLVKEVRNFAGISQQAMAQIIQTQTSLQKFGAEDIGARFNQAMSQGVRTLAQAEPAIASIIAESAQRAGQSMTGSMLTGGQQQRRMQQEIMRTLRGRLASIGLGGVDPSQLLDRLQQMRDAGQDTGVLEQQIRNVTGMGAGELQNLYKAYQESSMSFGDRMRGFEERINRATTPEGRQLAERQRDTFVQTDRRQQASQLTDLLSSRGNLGQALEQFNQRMRREGRADAQLQGPEAAARLIQQSVGDLANRSRASGVDFNAALRRRGLTQEGLQRGLLDPASAREFGAILQEVENEVMTQERANQDPVAKANLELKKVNEMLTQAVTRLYTAFASFELIMGAAVALMAAKAGMGLLSLPTGLLGRGGRMLGGLGRGAGRMLGIGGRAGATVAAEAGTAAAGQVAGRAAGAAAGRAGGAVAGRAAGAAAPGLLGRAGAGLAGMAGRAGAGLMGAGRAVGGVAMRAGGAVARVAGGVGSRVLGAMGVKALAGAGAKVAGLALGASNPIGWVVTLATALGGGFVNAMEAASKATEIFNVRQEELTYTQKAAAKSAGFLTGILDFITFGIFSEYIGPTGTWTVALAKFFDKFWPLALLGDMLLKPFEVLWAVIKGIGLGIWEYWKGLWDGFNAVWEPINEAFQMFKTEVLVPISGAFDEVFGAGASTFDIMQGISDALKWVGKQFGDFARWIGKGLGDAIRFLMPFIKTTAQWIAGFLVPALKGVFVFFKGLWQVLSGIFTLDGSKIWEGLTNIFKNSGELFGKAIKAFFSLFIQGIPLVVNWIVNGLKQAFNWLIFELPKYLAQGFMWLVTGIGELLVQGFNWLVTDLPNLVSGAFQWAIDQVPQAIWDALGAGFNWITTDLPRILQETFQKVMDFILSLIPGGQRVAEAAGGVSDIMNGDVLTGGRKILSAGAGLAADAANTVTNNAVTRALGIDFELFDIGSMGILQDGLAFLHRGEMVVPEEDAQALQGKATSRGAFNGGRVFGGFARSLGLGLFGNEQGGEAMTSGLDSFITTLTAPVSSIVDGIGSMFGFGGGRREEQPAQGGGGTGGATGGSWWDRMLNMVGVRTPQPAAAVQPEPRRKTVEEFLGEIASNGAETNRLLQQQASVVNSGLFDNTQVSEAIYETSEQANKEFSNMFGEVNSDALESVIIEAQEVLLGDFEFPEMEFEMPEPPGVVDGILASVQDMGLFARNTVTEALDTVNSETIQQGSLWENAVSMFDRMWNSSETDPSRNNGNQPTFWDRATQVWDQLTGRTERAASNPVETGLFAASNVRESFFESMRNGISNSPIGALADMFGFGPTGGTGTNATTNNNSTASAGSGLYYNNQSEYQEATTQGNASSGTTNNYINQSRRVRGLPVRGRVSSNLLASSGDVEEYILQRQLLDQPSGGSGGGMALPILERIAEAVESGRLDEIINLLTAIRDKDTNVLVAAGGSSPGGGAPSVENSGLRDGYNKSWLNGDWTHLADMSYSDNANILGTSRG